MQPPLPPHPRDELWSPLFDASSDCVKLLTPRGTLERVNAVGRIALGLNDEPHLGMEWVGLLPSDIRDAGVRALGDAVSGREAQFFGRTVGEGGAQTWNNLVTPLFNGDELQGIICTSRDVSMEHAAYLSALHKSAVDDLTQLRNRRSILRALTDEATAAVRVGRGLAVMLLDVDRLKAINDAFGHQVGDDALVRVAEVIRSNSDSDWRVGRVGGDEFMIVAPDTDPHTDDRCIALRAALESVSGYPTVHASVGVAQTSRGEPIDPQTLVECADADLYRNKRRRRLVGQAGPTRRPPD